MTRRRTRLSLAAGVFLVAPVHAGVYLLAEGTERPDVVTHPPGYFLSLFQNYDLKVCIDPASVNAAEMVTPLRNAIDRFNLLIPSTGNVRRGSDNDVPSNGFDFESVLTHEVGHCLGLGHPNLASESGVSGTDSEFTKTLRGENESYDLDSGDDGNPGSHDDQRADDINLHWFFTSTNNPFELPAPPRLQNFTNDVSELPEGSTFAVNGERSLSTTVFGLSRQTEVVMQQGQLNDEDQRSLGADDVAMFQYARLGQDNTPGTLDDYTPTLVYGGLTDDSSCDIVTRFSEEVSFASCRVTASAGVDDIFVTSGNARFNPDFNWHYSEQRIPFPVADTIRIDTGGTTTVLVDGATSLLANDLDQEGAGLILSTDPDFAPKGGNVTLNANGTFSYTHLGESASDQFVYRVCNSDGDGETNGCSHQFVNVEVSLDDGIFSATFD